MSTTNAFTVDVEDYFQVEAFSQVIDRATWDKFSCRVEKNTDSILELLDEADVKGTFFVLGWIARRYPNLIRRISDMGHEIASHGMSHQLIYKQDYNVFKQETTESKLLLEDISQQPVNGYRAATYSITNKSLWALDILCELGFKYDSSIFPILHDRYGIRDIRPEPHVLTTEKNNKIVEFPISVYKNRLFNLPISGGGYFRLYPYLFTKYMLKKLNNDKKEFIFYIHPWEIDNEQPRIRGIKRSTKFRHYNNIGRCRNRLEKLLRDFKFTTVSEVLGDLNLLDKEVTN